MDILFIFAMCIVVAIIIYVIIKRKYANNNNDSNICDNHLINEQFHIRDKQFHETIHLITTTKNPETFFSRINFAYDIAVEQQCSDWILHLDNNLDDYISNFITRSCKHELSKICKLKADNAREDNCAAYCSVMRSFFEDNTHYTEKHMGQLETELTALHNKIRSYSAPVMHSENCGHSPERSRYAQDVSPQIFEIFRKTIFLNWASHGYEINADNCFYPQYMKYDLEITSPRNYHQSLVNEGLLCECNFQEKLAQYTVPELKELLQKHGIPPKRTKQELIKAVLQLDEDILIEETAHLKRLKLTPDGEAFLDFNYGFVQCYRSKYNISLAEYVKIREDGILNYDEAAEMILLHKDKCSDYSTKLSLAQLYHKLQRYEDSLYYYIQVLYYGCEDKYGVGIVFAPHVVNRIYEMGGHYNDLMTENCIANNPCIKCVYSKKEFKKIVSNIVSTGSPN